jgi:hypothetical protein
LKWIYEYSKHNKFALGFTALNAIDNETDIEKLHYLLALEVVDNDEMNFWQWRIKIMENP